jgi:hypothetical protein
VQVSRWERGIDEWNGFLESNKFTNGQHTIRLVSINSDVGVKNHQTINADFNNLLCKVSDDDEQYYPDRNYHYSGYYNGGNSLEATLTGLYDNVIWSNTYSGDYIDINIPGSYFGEEKVCELNITDSIGGSGFTSEKLAKEFRMEDCNCAKMFILAPHKKVAASRAPAIEACMQACEARNVPWCYLREHSVNWDNMIILLSRDRTKFIYYAGHADSHIISKDKKTNVRRTRTSCWKYDPNAWFFKWEEIYVFSKTGIEPPLPDGWDYKGLDLWVLGMHEEWNKKIVFIDGCKSALSYMGGNNDMAEAYGMFALQGWGSKDQIYIGWRKDVSQAILDKFYDDTTAGVKLFWERMGRNPNDGGNVDAALQYTCDNYPPGHEEGWTFMWGENHETDFFRDEEDDGIFLWGLGGVRLSEIKLEP